MFPGVTSEPFSVVKLGPDCGPDAYSGYSPPANTAGFSMMHKSGTGEAPKYGVVSQQPVPGNISNPLEDLSAVVLPQIKHKLGFMRVRHPRVLMYTWQQRVTQRCSVTLSLSLLSPMS